MQVSAGLPFNTNKNSFKKPAAPSEDSNSFKDLLAKSEGKKKPSEHSQSKPVEKKKTIEPQETEVPQSKEVVAKPIQLENEDGTEIPKIDKAIVQSEAIPAEKDAVVISEKGKEEAFNKQWIAAQMAGKEVPVAQNLVQESPVNPEAAVSIKSSDLTKNTLVQNEKNILPLQNNMETVVPQEMPLAAMPTKIPVLGVNPKATGKIAIKPEMAMKQPLDVSVSMEEGLNPMAEGDLSLLAKDLGKESDADQSLESLFAQYMDQDMSLKEKDSAAFTQELEAAVGEKPASVENMDSIVKQARTFVDEGGGSMEIHLQPEGLGKVHLKVAVQNGSVNVEMLADNAAAKRALEENLVDIKTALEGQKLLVETLKVDMSQDYQKDFSDLRNQMQQNANRDFAEQFLGQFRQEREDRMSGMFDGFRTFQKSAPEPELAIKQRNPYADKGKGRTLNVVA